jgi:hypothetical protein
MSMDFESHRILTKTGQFRALVFTLTHSVVVRVPIDNYAAKVTTLGSMEELESWVRKKRWRLEKVRWFS